MKDIVYSKDNKIYLNTSLNEEMFAKTRFSMLLNEEGLLVKKDDSGKFNVFSKWKLDTSEVIEDSVFLSREGFSGKTLEQIICDEGKDFNSSLYNVISAITYAHKNDIQVPCNSPMGIICNDEEIIFLPEKTFDRSARNLGLEQYEKVQNVWRDAAGSGKKAESFLQATLAYYALTKKLPYPQDEESKQSVNIADCKFLPLEYCINGINKNLAFAVNDQLKNKLTDSKYFPLNIFKEELEFEGKREKAVDEEKFSREIKKFTARQKASVSTKRSIRRYYVYAIVAAIVIFIGCLIGMLVKSEQGKKPTVKGQNSSQVTEIFYKGIHHMLPEYLKIAGANCPQAEYWIQTVPKIYQAAQMAGAYNFNSGISTPENWLFFEPDTTKSYSHQIYGITNFTIDGKPSVLNIEAPKESDNNYRIVYEDKKYLKSGDQKIHNVEFYLIHTVENGLQVDHYNVEVTLTFDTDKWQITRLDQKFKTEYYNWANVSIEYKMVLNKNGNDIKKSVAIMKETYPWFPTKESMAAEEKYLDSLGY